MGVHELTSHADIFYRVVKCWGIENREQEVQIIDLIMSCFIVPGQSICYIHIHV